MSNAFSRLIQPVLVVSLAACSLQAGDMDKASREALLDNFDKSASEFAASIKGLTAEQWNFKPSPEVWSVAECAEHIVLTEDLLRQMVEMKVLTGEASPERVADRKKQDEKVIAMITDRSSKAKAPEQLKPTKMFAAPDDAVRRFTETRAKSIALVKSHDDLREHASPHPAFKELDAYQWLLYTSGHATRHTAQINEVKASAGFPK